LGFLKNNRICYNALKFKRRLSRGLRLELPRTIKVNMYKEINCRRKKVGGCKTVGFGKKKKRKLSIFGYTFLFKEEE
jgi:hypothetical protein